ncbi:RraA family protein [Pigmentiphaga sp. H8]|uniref:RraA family protein n=1 Tax=unclassified Pigmentiphaga TaxID=2626614 RepID=UPI000F596905|nr:RraA family protein [Pigmentiphaga sp. H8]AZG09962.1 RraA family protein [Pigmentiphaga sp. H8]
MKPGFRIHPSPPSPPAALCERFRGIPTPNISDSLGKTSPAGTALKPLHRGGAMIGPAVTVRLPPGDNLMVYKAIAAARPGDVLAVDAGGMLEQAIVGEIMTSWARQRGLAGIIIHGAVRDIDCIAESEFPVYACGYTHRGPYKDGPGELNIAISLDGMVVEPGDLLVGDRNGVIAIPRRQLEEVADAARAIQQREERLVAQIADGAYDSAWIDEALRERGYEL